MDRPRDLSADGANLNGALPGSAAEVAGLLQHLSSFRDYRHEYRARIALLTRDDPVLEHLVMLENLAGKLVDESWVLKAIREATNEICRLMPEDFASDYA